MKRFGKVFAQFICIFISNKNLRRKVRWILDPCSPPNLIKYFGKKYLPKVQISKKFHCGEKSDYIFQCWLQGYDNAPNIVKNCIDSVEKFKGHRKHILITNENLSDWVNIPQFILDKYKKGEIGHAHFADILRLYLLSQYGGYWIDATCLMTDNIPDVIENSNFFMFYSSGKWEWTLINNCFIRSYKGNSFINSWRDMLTEYWRGENRALDYFFCHLLFRTLLLNPMLKSEFDKMPIISQEEIHKLAFCLGDELNQKQIDEVCKVSFIQKLTYKLSNGEFDNPKSVASILNKRD